MLVFYGTPVVQGAHEKRGLTAGLPDNAGKKKKRKGFSKLLETP